MPAEQLVHPEIREATRRISHLLREETGGTVPVLFEVCQGLPSRWSAIDLVLALDPSTCRRLESVAMRHFQQQLRPRSDKKLPRAIAEMRSASKAWKISPLVLLVEFAKAPTSDNFWRVLSKLSRLGGDWRTVRERLHVERHRRQHDLLARRKGVSHSQPWAIPDIEAVMRQEQHRLEMDKNSETQMHKETQSRLDRTLNMSSASTASGAGKLRNKNVPDIPNARVEDTRDESSSEYNARSQDAQPAQSGVEACETVTDQPPTQNSAQPTVWRLAFGWWLSDDSIHQLCTSLVHLRPGYAVLHQRAISFTAAASGPYQTTPAIIIVPIYIKTSSHWILGTVSMDEKTMSLYDCIPSLQTMDTAVEVLKHICTQALPGEPFVPSDWAIVARSCPRQQSGADCSVVVVVLAFYFLAGRSVPSSIDLWLWRRMFACYLSRLSTGDTAQAAGEVEMAAEMATQHTATYDADIPFAPDPPNTTNAASGATRSTAAFIGLVQSCPSHLEGDTATTTETLAHRRAALRGNAMEAKAVWNTAAGLARKAETDERTDRQIMLRMLQSRRQALELIRQDGVISRKRNGTSLSSEENSLARSVAHFERDIQAVDLRIAEASSIKSAICAVLEDLDGLLTYLAENVPGNTEETCSSESSEYD